MAELTVKTGPLRGQTLSFNEDDPFIVGTAETCSLRLEGPGVAAQHLVIKALKDGGFGVKRLEGRFLLNGRGTDAARLSDGDVLEVGPIRLRFGPRDNGRDDDHGMLGGYRLIEILGRGGHGTVYRAEQMSLHREVALKVLPKETTRNPEFVGRFVAEARAAARLSHPNVVQVFDVGHDGDTYYLSMELMKHGSLEDRLRRDGRIPVEECLQFVIDAAMGLAYAESMGIVHRDIKPDNLMVDSHGTVKIADLGLAMSGDEEQGKVVGTPHFMAPEQVLARPLDNRTDLYSLGCTFFRLVTGRTLFPRRTTKEILTAQVKEEPESTDDVHEDVPAAVADLIDRLVEKDPDNRFQSAQELIDAAQHILHPPAKKGLLIAIISLLVLAIGGVSFWAATRPDRTEVVIKENATNKAMVKELRETKARARYNALLAQGLAALDLAAELEAIAKHEDYKGTEAADDAIAKAKDLRVAEAAHIKATRQRQAAIARAEATLRKRLVTLIGNREFKEAVAAFKPTDIAADLMGEQPLRDLLQAMRGELKRAATAHLQTLTEGIARAKTSGDPDALKVALDNLEAVLDKTTGWPREAFGDRSTVARLVATTKKDIVALEKIRVASRESGALANFRKQALQEGGVLTLLHSFDTAGAERLAVYLSQEVKDYQIGPLATRFAAVVRAAKIYDDDFRAAVAAGTVRIPVDVDGTVTDVVVNAIAKAFGKSGMGGLIVEVPKGTSKEKRTLETKGFTGTRLREVFPVCKKDDPKHAANRFAFLALHALAAHLDAASAYMASLDPKNPTSGTGDDRYKMAMSDLLALLGTDSNNVAAPWRDFLVSELRAAQMLSRGLRDFSRGRYSSAQTHLERLQTRHRQSLSVHRLRKAPRKGPRKAP